VTNFVALLQIQSTRACLTAHESIPCDLQHTISMKTSTAVPLPSRYTHFGPHWSQHPTTRRRRHEQSCVPHPPASHIPCIHCKQFALFVLYDAIPCGPSPPVSDLHVKMVSQAFPKNKIPIPNGKAKTIREWHQSNSGGIAPARHHDVSGRWYCGKWMDQASSAAAISSHSSCSDLDDMARPDLPYQ